MEYAKGLLSRAKELAVHTAQEIQGQRNTVPELRESHSTVLSPSASLSSVQTLDARIGRFKSELKGSRINLDNLRRLAFNGIPDSGNLRAIVWKVRGSTSISQHPGYGAAFKPQTHSLIPRVYVRRVEDIPARASVLMWCMARHAGNSLFTNASYTTPSPVQLLLGYLPLTPDDWSTELAKKRTMYHVFCEVS